tara:strand:+ start:457 stop:684 length:228 start_codon:yes stop_codon:yes gene_type:complete
MQIILYGFLIAMSILVLTWKTIGRKSIAKNWIALDWIMIVGCLWFLGGGVTGNLSVAIAGLFFTIFLWLIKKSTK